MISDDFLSCKNVVAILVASSCLVECNIQWCLNGEDLSVGSWSGKLKFDRTYWI